LQLLQNKLIKSNQFKSILHNLAVDKINFDLNLISLDFNLNFD